MDAALLSCPFCDKQFMKKGDLALHQSVHMQCRQQLQMQLDKCDCGKSPRRGVPDQPRRYICECPKDMWYSSAIMLTQEAAGLDDNHEAETSSPSAPGEKPFRCECGKNFAQQRNLTMHRRVHSGEKPFACECGRRFARKWNLTVHKKVHVGEKPYVCECGKHFARKWNLTVHKRVHMGEKPYRCECGKHFARKWNLAVHRRSHTGEKPYRCECGQSFVQKRSLASHMSVHGRDGTGAGTTSAEVAIRRLFS